MSFQPSYAQHNYLGEHANDTAALAFIQATKWDSLGNGTGTPINGMWYYDNTLHLVKYRQNGVWTSNGSHGVQLVTSSGTFAFSNIALALAASSSGNIVLCGPGVYVEAVPLVIPGGVTLVSSGGSQRTTITGTTTTGTRVKFGGHLARFFGFTVTVPEDAVPAVLSDIAVQTYCESISTAGSGTSLGWSIEQNSAGAMQCLSSSHLAGNSKSLFKVSAGYMLNSVAGIFGTGTVEKGVDVVGGTMDLDSYICFNPNVTDGISVGAGSIVANSCELRLATNGVHITSGSAVMSARGIRGSSGTWDFLVDPAAAAANVVISGKMNREKISYPASSTKILLSYLDTFEGDLAHIIEGELAIGRPESGREAVFGEGDSYFRGMKVVTSDSTATGTTEGGNLTDVSAEAISPSGSTFGFQGTAANHTIMMGTDLSDETDKLKFWGLKISQTVAAVEATKRSFAFEIWNGSAWVEIQAMAIESSQLYRYANEVFLRANSSEHVRFGIDTTTTWAKKTIDGLETFWVRIRIKTALTTAPTFEQFKLSSSRFEINPLGSTERHGLSRYRLSLLSAGNVFGETGGVVSFNTTVGTGADPASWLHEYKNSLLNGDGDAIFIQTTIPQGTDTSFPLQVELYWTVDFSNGTATDVSLTASILPLEIIGVLEADPAGGKTPVARTAANTEVYTANAAQSVNILVSSEDNNKENVTKFGPFDVSDYYENDVLKIRLLMNDDGVNIANIGVASLSLLGVKWTAGERL